MILCRRWCPRRKPKPPAKARLLTGKASSSMIQQYRVARRRTLLLDYDGTLGAVCHGTKLARPDAELLELLNALGADPANEVAIISGRPRRILEEWFGKLPVSPHRRTWRLVAEQGRRLADVEAHDGGLEGSRAADFQLYVDRLPGALLEEKEFSLFAWHHRRADPEQASLRAKELLDDLAGYTRNIDVQVFEGNKVIEIRNSGVNKGTAGLEWLKQYSPDFILGIGDDWTDEDLFRALPEPAFSVHVGVASTAARYYLSGPATVRRMLRELSESPREKM